MALDPIDQDPASAMMQNIGNDLTILALALANPEQGLPPEHVLSVLNRLSIAALAAGELHRRELAAVRGA